MCSTNHQWWSPHYFPADISLPNPIRQTAFSGHSIYNRHRCWLLKQNLRWRLGCQNILGNAFRISKKCEEMGKQGWAKGKGRGWKVRQGQPRSQTSLQGTMIALDIGAKAQDFVYCICNHFRWGAWEGQCAQDKAVTPSQGWAREEKVSNKPLVASGRTIPLMLNQENLCSTGQHPMSEYKHL